MFLKVRNIRFITMSLQISIKSVEGNRGGDGLLLLTKPVKQGAKPYGF